jgi:hypothetical protein
MNYSDEVVKLVTILNNPKITEEEKQYADKRLGDIRFEVTKHKYNLPEDRVDDVIRLEAIIDNPNTPANHLQVAKDSLNKIVNESSDVRSMRKSLLKELKSGRSDNVRDITDFVNKHKKYQNE